MMLLNILFLGTLSLVKISGLTVSTREKFNKIDTSTVYHVEEDIGDPEQVIYASYQSLNTLRKEGEPSIIAGHSKSSYYEGYGVEARFDYISSFHQVNSTLLLVVDQENHCLRLVNRNISFTKQFAGKCTVSHFQNGVGTEARFSSPHAVIPGYYKYEYYVTDSKNNAVRLLQVSPDYQNVSVSTVKQNNHQLIAPTGLALDPNNHQLLVLSGSHLVRIQFSEEEWVVSVVTPSKSCSVIIALPSINLFLMTGTKDNAIYQVTMNDFQTRRVRGDYSTGNCGNSKKWYSLSLSRNRISLYTGLKECIELITFTEPLPEYNRTIERRPASTTVSMVETTTHRVRVAVANSAEPNKGKPPDDVSSWTSYAFPAMIAAIAALVIALVAVVLKHSRRIVLVNRDGAASPTLEASNADDADDGYQHLTRAPVNESRDCGLPHAIVHPSAEVFPNDVSSPLHSYESINEPQTGTDEYLCPTSARYDNNNITIAPESPLLMEEAKTEYSGF